MPDKPDRKQTSKPGALQDVEEAEREQQRPDREIPLSIKDELARKPGEPVKPHEFKHW